MTFEKVHEGLDCNCIEFEGSAENTTDSFAHRVRNMRPKKRDFDSYYESGIPLRGDSPSDKYKCMHRGVSINKVDSSNEALIKEAWAEEIQIKPRLPSIYCKFRLKPDAGLVWPTPSSDESRVDGPSHHTLLKCDDFSTSYLEILAVESLL